MMQRVAVIAGATGALGRAICRELRTNGAYVVCGYAHARQEAEALAASLEGESLELRAAPSPDNGDSLTETLRSVAARHGRIDILVNAAGINRESPSPAMRPEEWEAVLNVNLGFAFTLTQAVLPHMLPQRYGRIVHLSSIAARAGGRGQINYAAAKAGLERMVRVFALEVGRKGITVNCVAPGVIVSPMSERVRAEHGDALLERIACRRFGEPDDVARAVAFLTGEGAGYINGAVLPVDGGMTL